MRILLLDDDLAVLRTSQRAIERMGHAVTAVSTCAEADAVQESLDLAVLDIELPDGSGVDVARRLLDQGRVRSVVFYSGTGHANLAGLGRLVIKPDVEGLRQAIDAALSDR